MRIAAIAIALTLFALPAAAQGLGTAPAPAAPAGQATPPGTPAPQQAQGGRDVPLARLLSDGGQVRGIDTKDRLVVQLGRFLFLCRAAEGKPHICDQMM